MSAVQILRRLAHNNAWSTLRLHRACAQLSEPDYTKERTSFFPSLPLTLSHILIVDWYYIDALERGGKGRALLANDMPYGNDFAALAAAQRASDLRLIAFTDSLTDDAS
ncbi:MAG: damage-inducible protein DinB, partial [Polyangiaceae bacterium]|nr:damage-inducible protein DinB [Polyangiaceae bacterium]